MSGTPILVVDDAPISRKMIRLLLTHDGYEVRTAERAEDALRMLSDYRPELILADIQLPGMNGLDMTRRVKEDPRTSSIKVVALTACAMKEDRERALNAGCDDYISKPINTAALSSKIRELIARPTVTPTIAIPANDPVPLLSGSEIEGLRTRFLEEGLACSRQLLDSLNSGPDLAGAARQFHEWTGSATLLGHPEISSYSRTAEELLREQPVNISRLREALTNLHYAFSDAQERKSAPLPDALVTATAGKRIALVGFSTKRADSMCALLERVKARPRLFDASDDPDCDAIRDCDLVVVHVRPENLDSCWIQSGARIPSESTIVFTGEQGDLIALAPNVRSRAVDLLLEHGEPEEVLMRLAFALSRSGAPASDPHRRPAAVDNNVSVRTVISRPRVVLADDDGIVRSLVSSTLENYGMSCWAADNGVDALRLIRGEQPQVVVLDVNMPGMDGFEVLAAIRAEKLPTQVILLTANQHEKDVLRAFHLGADDFLTKPFSPFELVARLKRLMR